MHVEEARCAAHDPLANVRPSGRFLRLVIESMQWCVSARSCKCGEGALWLELVPSSTSRRKLCANSCLCQRADNNTERVKQIAALAGILIILQDAENRKNENKKDVGKVLKRRRPRWWVRPWIAHKSLPECNTVFKLQLELEKVSKNSGIGLIHDIETQNK